VAFSTQREGDRKMNPATRNQFVNQAVLAIKQAS
jgi:hypothetical protein